jgi:GNAT superfamily N-acetyltransferase
VTQGIARRAWQIGYAELLPKEYLDSLGTDREPPRPQGPPERRPTKIARRVAELDGTVVGATLVCNARDLDVPESWGELAILNVEPAHWRKGIGRALVDAAEVWCFANDLTPAVLWTLADNERARRFYEACGWTADGTQRTECLTPYGLTEVRYRKTIVG